MNMMPEFTFKPPPNGVLPIIHELQQLYRALYQLGKKINKRDRLGLHAKIEAMCLEAVEQALAASLSAAETKLSHLFILGIKVHTLKILIRTSYEIKVLDDRTYLALEADVHKISGMTAKWIGYIKNKTSPR